MTDVFMQDTIKIHKNANIEAIFSEERMKKIEEFDKECERKYQTEAKPSFTFDDVIARLKND